MHTIRRPGSRRALGLWLCLLAAAGTAPDAAEPVKKAGKAAPALKKVTSSYSPLTSAVAAIALNPAALLPDLVPHVSSWISSCSWDESQGESCASECPPVEITLQIGARNASSRPLSGPVRVQVLAHPSGSVYKDWTVTDVPAGGTKSAGWLKKTVVRCHPPGQATVTQTSPNYKLLVETAAAEASAGNNAALMYIGPETQIGP